MRDLRELDKYRDHSPAVKNLFGDVGDAKRGAFMISSPWHRQWKMKIIACCGGGWEHVSGSFPDRCPLWEEMAWLKELFFHDTEAVMQLHVPKSMHINCHPNTLHLWRPIPHSGHGKIPLPPMEYV